MNILCYGGGVNSFALLIFMIKNKQQLDYIIFSDTGGEKPQTYSHLKIASSYSEANGYPPITVLPILDNKGLYEECIAAKRLPLIAYGFKSCSEKYKIRPFKKFLKENGIESGNIYKGIDADEAHRIKKNYDTQQFKNHYPLFENDFGRDDCIKLIIESKLPVPIKSACFFCPSSKKSEVVTLKQQNFELYQKAVLMEQNAKDNLTKIKGLGRTYRWEDVTKQLRFDFGKPIEISCDCHE